MLNSDSVLSQIFWCFWCSIEFVLKDRIDLRWIGPLHETSIQLNYLGVDFIQTCSNEKNSWNSGFVVLCCCFPWRMDLVFEKSQLLLFFPPLTKKKQTMMWQSCPSMCQLPRSKSPNLTQVGYQEFGAGKGWICATTSWWGGNEKTQPKGDVGTPGTPVVLEDWHQEEREDNRCGAVGVCVFFFW